MRHATFAAMLAASTLLLPLAGCTSPKARPVSANPLAYFEIPVTDMGRAMAFYTAIFGYDFERTVIDGYDMALLPFTDGATGATGALAKGDAYVPSRNGPILYLSVTSVRETLTKAQAHGATMLYPETDNGNGIVVAEIEDSEGNRIGLMQRGE